MKSSDKNDTTTSNHILKIFNFVGATLILFGIGYFITINWYHLSNAERLLSTLGIAIVCFAVAVSLAALKKMQATTAACFLISGLVLPLGLSISLRLAGLELNDEMVNVVITGTCLCVFLAAFCWLPLDIVRLLVLFYATLFFFTLSEWLNSQVFSLAGEQFNDYQLLIMGMGYLITGRVLQLSRNALTGGLYFFGSLFILLSCFDLGDILSSSNINLFGKVGCPLLVVGCFSLAVPFRSTALLNNGALFLLVYLFHITALYAAWFGNIGWPLLLIIAGVFLMVFGYGFVSLRRRIMEK